MNIYIITDENFPEWQTYEVHQIDGRRLLYTTDWNEVLAFFGDSPLPTPIIVEVG